MDFETLTYEVRDGVAYLTLARERAANALNLQMAEELSEIALRCSGDPAVRALVIGARGKMFCAGGDLSAFADAGDGAPTLLKRMTLHLHGAVSMLARMDAPVVAAVNGIAAGAGFSLVCACDLAVAAASARFTMAYTRAGLTPDGSSTYFLPRLVGRRRTLELMLTNRLISAQEAVDWGIVNQVVPDAELSDTAAKLAAQLASGPTGAFGITKRLVLDGTSESLETQLELEARGISAAAGTSNGREGITAFLEKRPPEFS